MNFRKCGVLMAGLALVSLSGCNPFAATGADAAGQDTKPANLAANGAAAGGTAAAPNFGDDNGAFSNDGECDDMRFEGAGMTSTPLLDSDIRHDASDCRTAFEQGRLQLAR